MCPVQFSLSQPPLQWLCEVQPKSVGKKEILRKNFCSPGTKEKQRLVTALPSPPVQDPEAMSGAAAVTLRLWGKASALMVVRTTKAWIPAGVLGS